LPTAIAVGVHGVWRLKKARFSISITPLNVSPSENAASAPAVTFVSSTGHLILVDAALGASGEGVRQFEIAIQLGAVLAAVVYYRAVLGRLLAGFIRREPQALALARNLAVAFAPAAVVGLLLHRAIERYLFGVGPVLGALVAGGVVMIAVAPFARRREPSATPELAQITARQALIVGLAQAVSLGSAFLAGFGVYLISCRLLGVRELNALLSLRSRFQRG